MLNSIDFCAICDGYDDIQTYIFDGNNPIGHICEECNERYKTDEEKVGAIRRARREFGTAERVGKESI